MAEQEVTFDSVNNLYKDLIQESLEKWVPRKFDDEKFKFVVGQPRYACDSLSATKSISDPIWDLFDRGGKRWRPTLMMLVADAQSTDPTPSKEHRIVEDLLVLCELVHNGSLVVDDIEDNSQLRRGKPCLHKVFTLDIAINAGNMMYFLGLITVRELKGKVPDPILIKIYEFYSAECINLHFGQGLDIFWHNGGKNPNIEEYLQMCAFKTGTLARLSAKLGAIVCGADDAAVELWGKFAESIGVAFQIQDDILNLVGEKFTTSITGEDITEGKRSLMVIHFVGSAPADKAKRLLDILALHTPDRALIDEAIGMLKDNGSIQFAREKAKQIVQAAWKDVENLIKNDLAKARIKCFADYLVNREI